MLQQLAFLPHMYQHNYQLITQFEELFHHVKNKYYNVMKP